MKRVLATNHKSKPVFLNVDLEIKSHLNLDILKTQLGESVLVLYSGKVSGSNRYLLALETTKAYKNPDKTIHALCDLIDKLSPSAQKLWAKCNKTFDIGYELQETQKSFQCSVKSTTLKRVAALGATLTLTCYFPKNL